MSDTDIAAAARPAVVPDARSQAFFDGCAQGQLLIRRCIECQSWSAPADPFCSVCGGGRLEWARSSGRGVVHTFGVVHHISHPGFRDEAPYNVAVIELEEGPRLNSRIIGCGNDDIAVGMPVEVDFITTDTGVDVPAFRPRAG
jgi:uncharacterized protein